MSYQDCLACREAGTTPRKGRGLVLTINPAYLRHGTPTNRHGLSAEWLALMVWQWGIGNEELRHGWPHFTREEQLLACWWAGQYGPRKWRQRFREWSDLAGGHLWHGCISIPDPPVAPNA